VRVKVRKPVQVKGKGIKVGRPVGMTGIMILTFTKA